MKRLLPILLLLAAPAFGAEVGGYPDATTLTTPTSVRLLADQNGTTVNVTPEQIQAWLFGNQQLVPSQNGITPGYVLATNGTTSYWTAQTGGGGGSGVSSLSGDGSLIINSASTGAVSLTLGSSVGYGIWGNTSSSSGAPSYHAMSSYPTAAFPTLNQDTTGKAAGLSGSPTNGQFWGYNGVSQSWYTPTGSGTVNSCTSGQIAYYGSTGTAVTCLTVGANLAIASATLNGTGGTVNSGTSGQLAYYGSTGTAISGATVATATLAALRATTAFTVAGTGCTPTVSHAGPFAGTVTLASGPCTQITVTINGTTGFTAPNGYHCTASDLTQQAAGTYIPVWGEKSSTTTQAVIPVPAATATTDVLSIACSDWF